MDAVAAIQLGESLVLAPLRAPVAPANGRISW